MAYYVHPVWKSGGGTSLVSPTKLRPWHFVIIMENKKKLQQIYGPVCYNKYMVQSPRSGADHLFTCIESYFNHVLI